jgi:hypothetical protein
MNGVDPCMWGPALWHFLHVISFNYPNDPTEQEKNSMYQFMMSLGQVLPCPECRDHYAQNTSGLRDALGSKSDFSLYMYNFHNMVNVQTGKKITLTYTDVYNKYNKLVSTSCDQSCDHQESLYKCKVDIVSKNEKDYSMIAYVMMALAIVILASCLYYVSRKKR